MGDKRTTIEEVVAEIDDGMTVAIGGWGSRRKPMALVRALARSGRRDLTIVSYGGPDVGVLCRTGVASKVISGFVSLDSIPLEPHYRKARQAATIEAWEYDEGMLMLALMAGTWRIPFVPTRAGLGSDIPVVMPHLQTVTSPYPSPDGTTEDLLAVPAINPDVALIHLHRADAAGNGQFLNEDLYMDDWMAQAADKCFMTCERLVETDQLLDEGTFHTLRISRLMTDGVIETPGGAHFTECPPDYARDEEFQREYAATAKDDDLWDAFAAKYLDVSEADYQAVANPGGAR